MNFYPHHIGDYLTATAHLTWQEDCAYRRLLDVYYSREQALPTEIAQACRLVRAVYKDERKAVETVLQEFFVLDDSGWTHSRCEEEIVKARDAAERARANGKKGGRPPKQKPTANPEITQSVSVANPEKSNSQAPITNPITNPSYSEAKASGGKPPLSADEIVFGYGVPLLTSAGTEEKQARSFLGKLRKVHGDEPVINALRDCIKAKPLQPLEWLAKALPPHPAEPKADPDSRSSIEAEGIAKGVGPWNEVSEQWHVYKARVRGKQNGLDLTQLAAMAAQRGVQH